jgi:hypothetical protein
VGDIRPYGVLDAAHLDGGVFECHDTARETPLDVTKQRWPGISAISPAGVYLAG